MRLCVGLNQLRQNVQVLSSLSGIIPSQIFLLFCVLQHSGVFFAPKALFHRAEGAFSTLPLTSIGGFWNFLRRDIYGFLKIFILASRV